MVIDGLQEPMPETEQMNAKYTPNHTGLVVHIMFSEGVHSVSVGGVIIFVHIRIFKIIMAGLIPRLIGELTTVAIEGNVVVTIVLEIISSCFVPC